MAALTDEMKETIARNRVVPMATASKDGIPNVVPMASIRVVGDDTIWIMNNYMVKTLRNLEENPIVALYFYDPESRHCFQVKGTAEIKTSGPDYEMFRDRVRAKSDRFPTRSLVVMKITDVFECMPGKGAGKKVL
jgi:predicted pyridoxine 5'-phosphate oxidase superfamily flavin-nucleotide-binding protein